MSFSIPNDRKTDGSQHATEFSDALWSLRLPLGARPRQSVALQITATTERGPPGHGHDRAWPSRSRPRQSVALQITAKTERGPQDHLKTCAQNADQFRHEGLVSRTL
jgi:hypothetical protein